MENEIKKPEDLDHKELVRLIMDMFHRTIIHHGLWFCQVERELGLERALHYLAEVWPKSYTLQMERLAALFGFTLQDGIPKALLGMPRESLLQLAQDLGRNWVAGDGIWFQAIEKDYGMWDAKRCNDSCWGRFSPLEASSIKAFLGLPEKASIDGLKKALPFRMYTQINTDYTLIDEGPDSVVLQINTCRVHAARKRKGLEDYVCKSAGIVEYRTFAETIDSRIKTICIACPPDEHPEQWYCAWRFMIPAAAEG
ncbi:MAG: hypothetical protein A4E66_00686 [Syntrophus sp. PtaB.Bin001]|nr:MAG: hypothetical protein A4E66_00686 [Syntrophus sp. PtaB.Bin001]